MYGSIVKFNVLPSSSICCQISCKFQNCLIGLTQAAFQENLQFVARFERIRKHISKRHEWLVKKYESVSSGSSENLPLKDSAQRLEALKALNVKYGRNLTLDKKLSARK
ncbi:hypothetical protein T02_14995 [Trichinella nativa]|uniref:Uncharacterized protein n=1 Tax=Trichinella nativa TaxID=6335 RepID=A0A0V1LTY3_9BILA|nr:hypothetical protein T02_14995 [Trichinella nativa]